MPTVGKKADRFSRACDLWVRGDLRRAFLLLLEAAKDGDESAQINVGHFFDEGLGTRKNAIRALEWYKKAYGQGSAIAATNVGTVFRDRGERAKALEWFKRGLRRGDEESALEIAKLYLAEPRDLRRAMRHLELAKASESVTEATQKKAEALLEELRKET